MPAPKGNQNAKGNKGGGAPSLYEPKHAKMAEKACLAGFTDIELADLLGVSPRTINNWKVEHVEFGAALKAGKDVSDQRVERSLFSRATGYEHDEVDIRVIGGAIVQTPIRKFYPPDTTAAIFWLKNRKPGEWRDKQELEHTGNVTIQASPLDERL
jgi:hypothetical protein